MSFPALHLQCSYNGLSSSEQKSILCSIKRLDLYIVANANHNLNGLAMKVLTTDMAMLMLTKSTKA